MPLMKFKPNALSELRNPIAKTLLSNNERRKQQNNKIVTIYTYNFKFVKKLQSVPRKKWVPTEIIDFFTLTCPLFIHDEDAAETAL